MVLFSCSLVLFPDMLRLFSLSALSLCLLNSCLTISEFIYPGAYSCDTTESPVAERTPGGTAVSYRMADGTTLRGWLWNRGVNASLVLVYGGNCMNVGELADLAQRDSQRSYLFVNYRGYGKSEGLPSEELLIADARTVLLQVRRQLQHNGKLALLGYSLGTGVATQLAATEAVDALILVCPFDSMLEVGCHHVPLLPRLVPMDHFRSDLAAPKVLCPVTILLGERDDIVPPDNSLRLAQCFTNTQVKLLRFPCGHNDIFAQRALYPALRRALKAMEAEGSGGAKPQP